MTVNLVKDQNQQPEDVKNIHEFQEARFCFGISK
jgi:hypothetical protein